MEVIRDIVYTEPCVATLGYFDGVHIGHRYLISELRREAILRDLPSVVITFPEHPRVVLGSSYQPGRLTTFAEKLDRLSETGVDACVVMEFTRELAGLSAGEFISGVLRDRYHVDTLLIGYDHRFGHDRVDGFSEYVTYGLSCGMRVLRSEAYRMNGEVISSSNIRRHLMFGEVELASRLLTYGYRLRGLVVHGMEIGRTLGYPTANLSILDMRKIWPGAGVYAVWVYLGGDRYKGMLSIGTRPTLHGTSISIEVHLLHFSLDIYDAELEVEFVSRLRGNECFDSLSLLREQLDRDCALTDSVLS